MAMRGTFTDGKSAALRKVRVEAGERGLILRPREEDGTHILWPYETLFSEGRLSEDEESRLSSTFQPEACLRLSPHDTASLLQERPELAKLRRSTAGQAPFPRAIAMMLAGFVALLILLVWRGPDMAVALTPKAAAEALGDQVIRATITHGRCEAGEPVLRALADRLIVGHDLPHPLTIRIAASPEPNAFAAPGGHLVMLGGLIGFAENPDEVAVVLAHEIAHSLHRDPLRALYRSQFLTIAINALTGGAMLAEAGGMLSELAYTRSLERRADATAQALLVDAGIDPRAMDDLFARLAEREGMPGNLPVFLRSHPRSTERIGTIALPPGFAPQPALDDKSWARLKGACASRPR